MVDFGLEESPEQNAETQAKGSIQVIKERMKKLD